MLEAGEVRRVDVVAALCGRSHDDGVNNADTPWKSNQRFPSNTSDSLCEVFDLDCVENLVDSLRLSVEPLNEHRCWYDYGQIVPLRSRKSRDHATIAALKGDEGARVERQAGCHSRRISAISSSLGSTPAAAASLR